ncbi:MAG: hypothetical protein BM485_17535 [Desulfobulbaceae bacterium DB1]|nr:MAG: hypothetical protein BM485_17535 [Desulfobulbaceae bacterium DB1]
MKKKGKGIFGITSWCLLFLAGCTAGQPVAAPESNDGMASMGQSPVERRVSYLRYSNLSELVTGVCDDAGEVFRGFYGPADVAVSPFAVISDYRVRKMTMLGITMADQMTAMINSAPAAGFREGEHYAQTMEGVIEEMDGYLRVHISGRNIMGERRGYVANVEMSEPIYRFLHSYVESH